MNFQNRELFLAHPVDGIHTYIMAERILEWATNLGNHFFILHYCCSFTGVDDVFLTGYKFIVPPWFI